MILCHSMCTHNSYNAHHIIVYQKMKRPVRQYIEPPSFGISELDHFSGHHVAYVSLDNNSASQNATS